MTRDDVNRAAQVRRDGRVQEAAEKLRAILDSPLITQVGRVEAYMELGKAYDRLGRRRDAQACFRRILALTDDVRYRQEARKLYRKAFRGE